MIRSSLISVMLRGELMTELLNKFRLELREFAKLAIIHILKFSPKVMMGVDVVELNVNTVTELDEAIPEKWEAGLRADAERMTFWGPNFEGSEGSGMPIIRKDDFVTEPGDVIHIQVFSPLAQTGVSGNTTLAGQEEQFVLGQFDVSADWVRHAVAFTKRATRRAIFDAAQTSRRALSKWMAKNIDDDMFQQMIRTESPSNLFAGNVADADSLGSSNVFTPDEIDRVKLQLQSQGSLPFDVIMDNGQERPMYGVVISEVSEYQLKSNSTWNQAQRDAGIRGEKNKIFTGAMGTYNGVIIYTQNTIQVSNKKWGSYIRPEARLSGSHNNSTTTITVGGSNTNIDYTEYFPQSGTFNILIDEEIMTVSASTNSTFTVTRGAEGTSAATHADGAVVALASASVERETAIAFGAESMVRTWAVLPTNQNELQDYRFKFGIGIEASYGQDAVVDAISSIANYLLLDVAAPRP